MFDMDPKPTPMSYLTTVLNHLGIYDCWYVLFTKKKSDLLHSCTRFNDITCFQEVNGVKVLQLETAAGAAIRVFIKCIAFNLIVFYP